MSTIFWDVETRSTVKLDSAGTWRYASDASTEVLCVGFAIDGTEPELWVPGQPVPKEFITAASGPSGQVVAHNAQFEQAIEACILHRRFGWPRIPHARRVCTMTAALACALPGALETVANILELPQRKDAEGAETMLDMAQPRQRLKGEPAGVVYWNDTPELRERLGQYCMRDVAACRAIYHELPLLPPTEQESYALDCLINERGYHIDRALALAARDIAHKERLAINAETAELTDGEVLTIGQVQKIVAYIRRHGHHLTGLTKRSVSALLAHDPTDQVRRLLELRQEGARASAAKLDRLLQQVDADNRLRGTLRFHGSHTGRWSGRGFQPQNLAKTRTDDIGAAVDAILAGDMARVRGLGAPLTLAGEVARATICAAPGHRLIGADFSAIESRVLSWIAGEKWKLANYRAYDLTGDPALEPYCVGASKVLKRTVTPDDEEGRACGKLLDLSFGFGGGLGAWRRFDNSDTYTDSEVEKFKEEWRHTHRATWAFWHELERKAHAAVFTRRRTNLGNRFAFEMENGTLYVTLPSGRRLSYPEARLAPGKFENTREIQHKDNSKGGWHDRGIWYGTLTENVVQAIARDLLAAAMLRLEHANYAVVLHVHDEIVCEVPEGFGSEAEFLRIMLELPEWAEGLPIAAKVWSGPRYIKAKTAIAAPVNTAPAADAPFLPFDAPSSVDTENLVVPLEAVIRRPLSSGKMLCCPFHDDSTPSMKIYEDDRGGHYHCHACGAHGGTIDWLTQVEGMEREDAVHLLETWGGPLVAPALPTDDGASLELALRLWDEAQPIAGTPAERYLAQRRRIDTAALPADTDAVLRFHPRCLFGSGARRPCLLALMRDIASDAPAGIQRIALDANAQKIERKMLGRWSAPRAVKIWPAGRQLIVGEGLETVLAAATRIPYRGEPLRPAWALLSAPALARFPVVADRVERLIILVDHDTNGEGQAAAAACADRWSSAGHAAIKLKPGRAGMDFNDLVLEAPP